MLAHADVQTVLQLPLHEAEGGEKSKLPIPVRALTASNDALVDS